MLHALLRPVMGVPIVPSIPCFKTEIFNKHFQIPKCKPEFRPWRPNVALPLDSNHCVLAGGPLSSNALLPAQ